MKNSGGGRGASRSGRAASARPGAAKKTTQPHRARPKKQAIVFDAPVPVEEEREFRLGVVPGATPAKWIALWRERVPKVPLVLVHLRADDAARALLRDEADAVILRLPAAHHDLRSFDLYEETPVVIVSAESSLTVGEEISAADLAGEVVIVPADDVLRVGDIAGTIAANFDAPATTEDAVEIAASGVGIVIAPMSLARLHHRKDVEFRPFTDAPVSPVGLAWHADRETDDVKTFIGIVRGRTANSSRD